MVIDLPASSQNNLRGQQNPVTQLSAQRQDAVQAALKALNIKAGETVQATVKSISVADNQLRTRLIQLANPATETTDTSVAKNSTSPTNSGLGGSGSLPQLTQRMLQSANLALLELNIRGKTLLVFTDRPTKTGQTVNIQLHQGSLLVVPQKTNNAYTSHIRQQTTLTPNETLAKPSAAAALSPQQRSVVQTELRGLMPSFEPRQAVSALTQTLASVLAIKSLLSSQLPQPSLTYQTPGLATMPRDLQESLQQLANHLRTPQQLSQPTQLKQALLNSGIQLEHKLLSSSTPNKLPQEDLKAALLHTLAVLNKSAAANSSKPPAGHQSAAPTQALATPTSSTPNSLLLLLQQMASTQSGVAVKASAEQIAPQLQQQILLAINKLLYSQLQSISRSQPAHEGQPTQQLQLEIPIRYGHEVHSVQIQLEEDWIQEYAEGDQKTAEKVRQWLVKLAFDLPDAGSVHAHITVIQDTVSTSLWADHSSTFSQIQASLSILKQRLEKDGCCVKKIECFEGAPQEESIQLGYSLVDIKT